MSFLGQEEENLCYLGLMKQGTKLLSYEKTDCFVNPHTNQMNGTHEIDKKTTEIYREWIIKEYLMRKHQEPYLSIEEFIKSGYCGGDVLHTPSLLFKPILVCIDTGTSFSRFYISDPTDNLFWYPTLCLQVSEICGFTCGFDIFYDGKILHDFSLSSVSDFFPSTSSIEHISNTEISKEMIAYASHDERHENSSKGVDDSVKSQAFDIDHKTCTIVWDEFSEPWGRRKWKTGRQQQVAENKLFANDQISNQHRTGETLFEWNKKNSLGSKNSSLLRLDGSVDSDKLYVDMWLLAHPHFSTFFEDLSLRRDGVNASAVVVNLDSKNPCNRNMVVSDDNCKMNVAGVDKNMGGYITFPSRLEALNLVHSKLRNAKSSIRITKSKLKFLERRFLNVFLMILYRYFEKHDCLNSTKKESLRDINRRRKQQILMVQSKPLIYNLVRLALMHPSVWDERAPMENISDIVNTKDNISVTPTIHSSVSGKQEDDPFSRFCTLHFVDNPHEIIKHISHAFIGCSCSSNWNKKPASTYLSEGIHDMNGKIVNQPLRYLSAPSEDEKSLDISHLSRHITSRDFNHLESSLIGCSIFDCISSKVCSAYSRIKNICKSKVIPVHPSSNSCLPPSSHTEACTDTTKKHESTFLPSCKSCKVNPDVLSCTPYRCVDSKCQVISRKSNSRSAAHVLRGCPHSMPIQRNKSHFSSLRNAFQSSSEFRMGQNHGPLMPHCENYSSSDEEEHAHVEDYWCSDHHSCTHSIPNHRKKDVLRGTTTNDQVSTMSTHKVSRCVPCKMKQSSVLLRKVKSILSKYISRSCKDDINWCKNKLLRSCHFKKEKKNHCTDNDKKSHRVVVVSSLKNCVTESQKFESTLSSHGGFVENQMNYSDIFCSIPSSSSSDEEMNPYSSLWDESENTTYGEQNSDFYRSYVNQGHSLSGKSYHQRSSFFDACDQISKIKGMSLEYDFDDDFDDDLYDDDDDDDDDEKGHRLFLHNNFNRFHLMKTYEEELHCLSMEYLYEFSKHTGVLSNCIKGSSSSDLLLTSSNNTTTTTTTPFYYTEHQKTGVSRYIEEQIDFFLFPHKFTKQRNRTIHSAGVGEDHYNRISDHYDLFIKPWKHSSFHCIPKGSVIKNGDFDVHHWGYKKSLSNISAPAYSIIWPLSFSQSKDTKGFHVSKGVPLHPQSIMYTKPYSFTDNELSRSSPSYPPMCIQFVQVPWAPCSRESLYFENMFSSSQSPLLSTEGSLSCTSKPSPSTLSTMRKNNSSYSCSLIFPIFQSYLRSFPLFNVVSRKYENGEHSYRKEKSESCCIVEVPSHQLSLVCSVSNITLETRDGNTILPPLSTINQTSLCDDDDDDDDEEGEECNMMANDIRALMHSLTSFIGREFLQSSSLDGSFCWNDEQVSKNSYKRLYDMFSDRYNRYHVLKKKKENGGGGGFPSQSCDSKKAIMFLPCDQDFKVEYLDTLHASLQDNCHDKSTIFTMLEGVFSLFMAKDICFEVDISPVLRDVCPESVSPLFIKKSSINYMEMVYDFLNQLKHSDYAVVKNDSYRDDDDNDGYSSSLPRMKRKTTMSFDDFIQSSPFDPDLYELFHVCCCFYEGSLSFFETAQRLASLHVASCIRVDTKTGDSYFLQFNPRLNDLILMYESPFINRGIREENLPFTICKEWEKDDLSSFLYSDQQQQQQQQNNCIDSIASLFKSIHSLDKRNSSPCGLGEVSPLSIKEFNSLVSDDFVIFKTMKN